MSDYFISDAIEIKKSVVHGDGVFAKQEIKKDTTIEVSKLLRLGWRMAYQNDPIIRDYCWGNFGCTCEQCKVHGPNGFIALGFGSIYNHSDEPNISIKLDYEKLKMTITTNRDIQNGEELFVSYGPNYWKTRSRNLTTPTPAL